MPISDAVKDLLSFGAHSRVEQKRDEYGQIQQEYELLAEAQKQKRQEIDKRLTNLALEKKSAIEALKNLREIARNLSVKDRDAGAEQIAQPGEVLFRNIEETVTDAEIAGHALQGTIGGISAALGVWSIAGTYGLASTGAALTTLTGAAATTFLGGSALAASGGSMVAGAAVLGGAVLIPAAAIMAVSSHVSAGKKIAQIEKSMADAQLKLRQTQAVNLALANAETRIAEITESLVGMHRIFVLQMHNIKKRLYPFGKLSRALKSLRKFFGFRYFNTRDVRDIDYLGQFAMSLAALIDQRALDDEGNIL